MVSEIPVVHDVAAIDSEYDGVCLRLKLRWEGYSAKSGGTEVTETRALCFLGVQDIDARPPFSVQADYRPGCLAVMLKLGSLGINFGYPEGLKTAAQLMGHIRDRAPGGDVILGIERTQDGFIVKTVVGYDYYVRASRVTWCDA